MRFISRCCPCRTPMSIPSVCTSPSALARKSITPAAPDGLSQELAEVRPTLMTAVPRLYEVLHDRITRGVARAGGVQAALFQRAVTLGRKAYGDPVSLSFGERLVNGFLTLTVRRKVGKRFGAIEGLCLRWGRAQPGYRDVLPGAGGALVARLWSDRGGPGDQRQSGGAD